ncbi:MAG: hypothetical protein HRT71_04090 [Flavobacteriales bacterium]|nr:hypothetical protein [Flavobacteriales bacterium]
MAITENESLRMRRVMISHISIMKLNLNKLQEKLEPNIYSELDNDVCATLKDIDSLQQKLMELDGDRYKYTERLSLL